MTIIAATSWGGEAYIGADSAGTDFRGLQRTYAPKLFRYSWGAVGFTASFRATQVVDRHLRSMPPPKFDGECNRDRFVDEIADALKASGWKSESEKGTPSCEDLCALIITSGGHIYELQQDLALLSVSKFGAVGSGDMVALGSLHTAEENYRRYIDDEELSRLFSPLSSLNQALDTARELISTCAGSTMVHKIR